VGRYTDAKCKLCRLEGNKLFLKGDRCYTDKCAYERKPYPPGANGQRRHKFTEYGVQLREKQKVKRMYGLAEKQFKNIYHKASRKKGATGETLLTLLERRLDNVIYKLGFASSRQQARQQIRHSHFLLNNRKVNIPSIVVNKDDLISIKEKSRKVPQIIEALEAITRKEIPSWLSVNPAEFKGQVLILPTRQDITADIEERMIVELYSK
jgi:small subunit ribosomal protein S4